jgi:ABC-2 type transport system permease protein
MKSIRDTYLILRSELSFTLKNPYWMFYGLLSPVIYLVLFSPFLNGIANTRGFPSANAIQFFAPGVLIMNAMFNTAYAGFGFLEKLRSGFIERLRVTPVSRLALALGFVLVNTVTLIIQSAILILAAVLFFGLTLHPSGTLALVILLLMIGISMASLSYTLALTVNDSGILTGITNFFTLPLLLLSGIMLPVEFAPPFIKMLSRLDPFTYAVDAARALMNGTSSSSVITAFMLFTILAFLSVILFIKVMRRAVA